jgi:hypothetical protein
MTEDRDLIQRYLDQLRLSLRIPEVGRILVEAEDHLRAATAAKIAEGLTQQRAQEAAIAGFGPVHAIVYAHQTRHGKAVAMLADLAISAWRVVAWYLLAAFALDLNQVVTQPRTSAAAVAELAATGAVGLALPAAYFAIRRFQRRRGRVWSIPLGGFFPLFVVIASGAVGVGMLLLDTTHAARLPGAAVAVVVFLALGMVVTYGWRMGRMLLEQERHRELA